MSDLKKNISSMLRNDVRQERRASRTLFFLHINSVTDKITGAFWGAGFSLPLGEPRNICRILRQVVRGIGMRTKKKMCVTIGTHDEKQHKTT